MLGHGSAYGYPFTAAIAFALSSTADSRTDCNSHSVTADVYTNCNANAYGNRYAHDNTYGITASGSI